ncbi:PREDICTED: ran-binding protein 3 [Polistes dominula]|uniref:Ran-binding protein 3 n=1 Tax=Polistes dominula TaxID=743375 RepID=A0ABM1IIK1_POLDO|nr:PREDICTED: ran-binding protein 3 [Polistes dominula]
MEGQSVENNTEESAATTTTTKPTIKIHCPVLKASKFGNSFGVNEFSSKPRSTILRPSQLGSVANNTSSSTNKTTILQSPKLNNVLTKSTDEPITNDNNSTTENDINETKETKTEKKQAEEKQTEEIVPKFLPLCGNTKDNENNVNNTVEPSASEPSFIFGQNLKERVTVANDVEETEKVEKEETKKEETNENGSSELLFSNAATVCRSASRPGLTLSQAAQELEEASRANKRKYNEVTLLTGEEGETNVLQINCKLFAFDKASSSWQERGRGTLRLNDRDEESRLVGRTVGTQRLILNTKVWPGMTAERASPKSLRLTAMDVHGDIRIFIVQAIPKEIELLHTLLLQRIKRAQERQPKKRATEQH